MTPLTNDQITAGAAAQPVATVIKKGADRQWMSESLGSLPDGMYSLYLSPSPQIAEKVELPPLPVLQDAAQAINRLLGAVEGLSYVDSAREFGERTLTNILRITEAAPASAGQADAVQAGRQYQRKVDEKIIARRDAEIASLRAGQAGQVAKEPMDFDRFFEVVRASERAAVPASGDISQSAPVAHSVQSEKAAAANAGVQDVREAFEAWHRSKFETKHCTGQPTRDMHNGIYAEKYGPESQQLMWEAWQAAAATRTPAADAGELPDHIIREAVNQVRDIALEFHSHGSLRERLSGAIVPLLKARAAATSAGEQ